MKKAVFAFIIIIITLIVLVSISSGVGTAEATNDENYIIKRVDHTIKIMYDGCVFINDTIQIDGNASGLAEPLTTFRIGFPYKYGQYVLRCVAYNESDVFNVTLDVPLEDRMGFYAVEIRFPQPLETSVGTTHVFTVGFIMSNDLFSSLGTNRYILDFPAYPSLTKSVTNCSASIVFPGNVTESTIVKDDGAYNESSYVRENLPAFAYVPANVTFTLTSDKMRLLDIDELNREIIIDELGGIEGSDGYYITNKESESILAVEVVLPSNASNVRAYDLFGRKFDTDPTLVANGETNRYRVAFSLPLEGNKSTSFSVKYDLASQAYIDVQEGTGNFNITFPLFQHIDYYVERASVAFVFPEGARVLSTENTLVGESYSLTRNVFQETIAVNKQGVSCLEDIFASQNVLQVVYEYNPLWLSFRPTLWMCALVTVGCAIAVAWKRRKAPVLVAVPTAAVRIRPEYLKSFVDSYEEKRKIILELESIETMVRKGKMPRRRYKVRRKTLETRLDTLSRSLTEFKERMRAGGGKYADLMRQLEVAETETNEVEANIKSIEARHGRGEISLETYRKLLADYQRRKEAAETSISGILLRIREEIR